MLELLIVILAATIGYIFLRSQGESTGGLGIKFQPYPNTPEGRKKRARGLLVVALVMGTIIFAHARSEYLSLSVFGLIALSALILVFFSTKKK